MDHEACNIVYVDRTASGDRIVKRGETSKLSADGDVEGPVERMLSDSGDSGKVDRNLEALLQFFAEVHVCTTGKACLIKLIELHETSIVDLIPTIVLIDVAYSDSHEDQRRTRTPSPTSPRAPNAESLEENDPEHELYGMSLLQWIVSDIQQNNLSKLIVPIVTTDIPQLTSGWPLPLGNPRTTGTVPDQNRILRLLDAGAVDVLTRPFLQDRLPSLAVHAYRAHKESAKEHKALQDLKRGRKRSWVGLDDQKPYAYLREAMVSGLMDGICRLGDEEVALTHVRLLIPDDREKAIEAAVGSWYFSAHDFSDDELLQAAVIMLQHALSMPELEQWRMPAENLTGFLMASRAAYNAFVPYHNFRHVIDVLQACFHFLVRIGTIPPLAPGALTPAGTIPSQSPIASLLRPFDALTLLITAIGHDVGHPGVNNAFLVTLNAPLAQLYNDRSVLESFHCAAYSQILRRHWPTAFSGVEMRQLMISSILATDMGLHFDYMKKLGFLEEKLHDDGGTDGWNGRVREEYRTLACSLLIKCADISNVARRFDVAAKWTMILTDEFARQASMERDLAIPSALFAPPVREIIELGQSQIGFMNMFAIPLFQGVTDVLPAMQFCVDELQKNRKVWEDRVEMEQAKKRKDSDESMSKDGKFSPRNMSMVSPLTVRKSFIPTLDEDSVTNVSIPTAGTQHNGQNSAALHSSPLLSPDSNFSKFRGLNPSSPDNFKGRLNPEDPMSPQFTTGRGGSDGKPSPGPLELSYATGSAPGLIEQPNLPVENSLVTDAVVYEPVQRAATDSGQNREGSRSDLPNLGVGNGSGTIRAIRTGQSLNGGGSRAASAATGQVPLTPSTKGTSVTSDDGNIDAAANSTPTIKESTPALLAPGSANSSAPQSRAGTSGSASRSWAAYSDQPRNISTRGGVNENDKNHMSGNFQGLAKKSSRSRFKFWKKKASVQSESGKEDVPCVPGQADKIQ